MLSTALDFFSRRGKHAEGRHTSHGSSFCSAHICSIRDRLWSTNYMYTCYMYTCNNARPSVEHIRDGKCAVLSRNPRGPKAGTVRGREESSGDPERNHGC